MPLQKDLSTKPFLMVDKAAYEDLSNNARLVYLAFVDVHPNIDPTDRYMAKKCDMGLSRYKESKKELVDKQYLYVQRLGAKGATIVYHFGKKAVVSIRKKLRIKHGRKG